MVRFYLLCQYLGPYMMTIISEVICIMGEEEEALGEGGNASLSWYSHPLTAYWRGSTGTISENFT